MLRPYVECLWTRRAADASGVHRILPDGCIDVLLSREASQSAGPLTVVGTMTRALVVEAESVEFVGVRFRPGRAHPFLGIPAAEVTDRRVDAADVWGRGPAVLELREGEQIPAVLRSLEQLLVQRIARARPANRTVDAAVSAILRASGNLSISTLAPALGVTRQYLARSFAVHVGVSPKTFARVARLRGVLARARVAARLDWTALALDAGYYDQAHLIDEVKEMTGLTPTDWIRAG